MNEAAARRRVLRGFEVTVIAAVGLLLVLAVAIAIVVMYVLFINGVRTNLGTLESVSSMQASLQQVFGGVLLVLLGLELIETLKVYFSEHQIRTEVILVVAIIAVGRHVIQIDYEHAGGLELIGVAGVMLALAVSYFLIKRTGGSSSAFDSRADSPRDP
jgi:uncharacterized membrane protein (DUF373 family)